MSGFAKVYSSMLRSSVWFEAMETRLVWITLLMLSDANGFVDTSVLGLADAAKVPLPATREALSILSAPDPESKTTDHEGRRIEQVDGGFNILNHEKYRKGNSQSPEAIRKRNSRNKTNELDRTVTDSHGQSRTDVTKRDCPGPASVSDLNKRGEPLQIPCPPRPISEQVAAQLAVDFEVCQTTIRKAEKSYTDYWLLDKPQERRTKSDWMSACRKKIVAMHKSGELKSFRPEKDPWDN